MKTKLWKYLSSLIDRVTKRECTECKYNKFIYCGREDRKGDMCRRTIFPVGFERKK